MFGRDKRRRRRRTEELARLLLALDAAAAMGRQLHIDRAPRASLGTPRA